ncbi:outer membrane protein assembly factor BamE [Bradyrhizobium sp. Ash2021]|uniref:outer membrane protein assembly factor BamE domain-containing protein n=1 Tax=Bradyrhizobium sp. Ash2021 TaxID=2954771 RepID=UPI0028159DE4|nr:outer membrane protein assembly factor BamE [Bradyrhizobium sp. Ash2021]WMT71785.1 outer membrane protein assembly factor BamE [Bradyrhizobium sp. Ash2021]
MKLISIVTGPIEKSSRSTLTRLVIAAFALLLFVHGASAFEWADAKRVKVGMTQAEVIAILGQPRSVATLKNGDEKWLWMSQGFQNKSVSYGLRNGLVTLVPNLSAFE